jgi:antitoxin component YwqK of YwqJK toxin-antitoxin module
MVKGKHFIQILVLLFLGMGNYGCTNSVVDYWSNGQVKSSIHYHDKRKNNFDYCEYYHSGALKVSMTYVDFKLHGGYFEYYLNGQLKMQRTYVNGNIEGKEIHYSNLGLIKTINVFEGSRLIRHTNYKTDTNTHKNLIYEEQN